jgi:phosphopantetheine--protein transferase-like protein
VEKKVFSDLLRCGAEARAVRLLASTWAAKEALYKSLSICEQRKCRFSDWRRVEEDVTGRRLMKCEEYEKRHPQETILVSVSHDGDYTMASVYRVMEGKCAG